MVEQNDNPQIIWLNVNVFLVTTLIAFIGVPTYAWLYGLDVGLIIALLLGIGISEICITAGYHRLWSHRAYEANVIVRLFFMLGGTFAMQNSILHWVSDHRRHHRYVDDLDKDPYSAKRGFWYSHIGWMLREYSPEIYSQYDNCKDLQRDPIVMWQHRYYLPLVLLLNLGVPIIFGLWHGDLFGMMLMLGVTRLVITHHFTFLINSLAHIWGSQPYSDKNTAKDNGFLALLTMGEGYHNYHHQFQNDYRNGIRWWQFDPSKWLIRALASLNMAHTLRRTPFERIESSRAQRLLEITRHRIISLPNAEALMQRLQTEYDLLMLHMEAFTKVRKDLMRARKDATMKKVDIFTLKRRSETLKLKFLAQHKEWLQLNAKLVYA